MKRKKMKSKKKVNRNDSNLYQILEFIVTDIPGNKMLKNKNILSKRHNLKPVGIKGRRNQLSAAIKTRCRV